MKTGDLLNDRYLIIQPQILLDTKPGQTPLFTEKLDNWAIRYAELFPYKNHIPQIYGYLKQGIHLYELLENSAIYPYESTTSDGQALTGQLMPDLPTVWSIANLEQQISWIIQIFKLWEPLKQGNLLQTLFQPSLVRVDSNVIRLLHVVSDQVQHANIADFAVTWSYLLDWHNSSFWTDVLQKMIQGQILNSSDILAHLDHEMVMIHLDTTGSQVFDVDIATLTNCGPSRTENQDACYPISNTYLKRRSNDQIYVAVCDGIGGHEGGSVASKLAIATIEEHLAHHRLDHCSSNDVESVLENAVLAANDVICELNDQEHRREKQRMGTTIVLAYIRQNQLFITYVGDSRAYYITFAGCHQLTVDDDLASQSTIYGSSFYREALQYSGMGVLTQALGMSESAQLQPKTQRYYLTGHCLFLLCSDGLSDFDLVDQVWATELKSVLHDRTQLLSACERLIQIANRQNGHDNVTVGLLHILRPDLQLVQQLPNMQTAIALGSQPKRLGAPVSKTRVAVVRPRSNRLKTSLFSLLLLGIVGGLSFAWWRSRQPIQPDVLDSVVPSSVVLEAETLQKVNQILQVKPGPVPLSLLPKPDPNRQQVPIKLGDLLPGTIVQVKSQLTTETQENWVMLKVCSVPAESNPDQRDALLIAGTEGWQMLPQIGQHVMLPSALPPEQLGQCAPPPIEATPMPPSERAAPDLPTALPTAPNQSQ